MDESGSNLTSFSVPQHPLPEEIQKMERDETVCKFCGVSYLIHNEVKALQERLAEAEKQMEYYKDSVEREKVLIIKLEEMEKRSLEQSNSLKDQEQQLELFKGDLKMKANLINEMYSQKSRMKTDLEEAKKNAENLKTQLSKFSTVLPKLNNAVRQQKDVLNNLKMQADQQKKLTNNEMNSVKKNMKAVLHKVVEKVNNERKTAEKRVQELKEEVLKSQEKISQLSTADKQLNELQTKSNDLQNKATVYEKQACFMEEQNKILKEKCSAVEMELHAKLNESKKLQNDLENLQAEKHSEILKHQDSLIKKDEEISRLNVHCKSLERLMKEKSVSENEVRNVASGKDAEVKTLQRSLSQVKIETEALKLEREQTIVAHHNRIEQLRESYSKKLGDTETSYGKLRQEFEHQQKIIENDFEEEKKELKNKFEKEKDAMNSEHDGQLRGLQSEMNDLNEKIEKAESLSKRQKEELYELKNDMSSNKTKNTQESQKYQNEILELRRKLENSEQRRQEVNENNQNMVTGNVRFQNLQKSLQDANAQVDALTEQMKKKKNEMTILQDTVRQECEERLELTQALSNARMQLLASGPQNSGTSRHSPNAKTTTRRLIHRSNIQTKSADLTPSSSVDVATSVTNLGRERRTRSTGSDSPRPTRESVDSFRERIAVALGRPNRVNITR